MVLIMERKHFKFLRLLNFPQKSHECALKLNDLWIKSLLFDLNYKFIKIGASLLALAKSIYYEITITIQFHRR